MQFILYLLDTLLGTRVASLFGRRSEIYPVYRKAKGQQVSDFYVFSNLDRGSSLVPPAPLEAYARYLLSYRGGGG